MLMSFEIIRCGVSCACFLGGELSLSDDEREEVVENVGWEEDSEDCNDHEYAFVVRFDVHVATAFPLNQCYVER